MRSTQITGQPPVGVILAGGRGTRIGGNKAAVALRGEPLLHHVLRTMREVVSDVAIVAKPQTVLPRLEGAMVWLEPAEPAHPMVGVGEALALAGGRPVLVCPLDMPFVSPGLLALLASANREARPAVMAACRGIPQPLLARYLPEASPLLAESVQTGGPLHELATVLEPKLVEMDADDEVELFDVDTPDDLLQAAAMFDTQRPARTGISFRGVSG